MARWAGAAKEALLTPPRCVDFAPGGGPGSSGSQPCWPPRIEERVTWSPRLHRRLCTDGPRRGEQGLGGGGRLSSGEGGEPWRPRSCC